MGELSLKDFLETLQRGQNEIIDRQKKLEAAMAKIPVLEYRLSKTEADINGVGNKLRWQNRAAALAGIGTLVAGFIEAARRGLLGGK